MKSHNAIHNCVWIEVEDHKDATRNEIVAIKATQLIQRLGVNDGSHFRWSISRKEYQYMMGANGCNGYYSLPECGHIFNLDYLAG